MASESDLAGTLAELLAELDHRNVLYALAGGWAFSALVEPRATTDIDLLILLDSPSQQGIQSLVSPIFTSIIVHPRPMKLKGVSIWRCLGLRNQQEVVLDFLLADSDFLKSALARQRQIFLGGQQVAVLALEDLMLMKMVAGFKIWRIWKRSKHEKPSCMSTGPISNGGRPCSGLRNGRIRRPASRRQNPPFGHLPRTAQTAINHLRVKRQGIARLLSMLLFLG